MPVPKLKVANVSLALMASSLALLIILQFLWLKNSYEKAHGDLRKDANDIFRETIHALRDSSLMRNVKREPADSFVMKKDRLMLTQKVDCVSVTRRPGRIAASEMKIVISDGVHDSVGSVLRPLVSRLHSNPPLSQATFYVQMRNDSLPVDTIVTKLRQAMTAAGIEKSVAMRVSTKTELPLKLSDNNMVMRRRPMLDSAYADRHIRSDWVSYDPFHQYQVKLSGYTPMLFREILPQILFAAFVTLLTATAFAIMYRSLRAQQRLVEMKNDFISNITHELKTPVTTVSVALEALRDFNGLENPQTTRDYLDIAQSELNRLTLLTDKILKTAIFENKGIGFEPEPVDMLKTVNQILHSMKLVFDKQKAQVSFERTGDSFTIIGGSVHLTNVIYNLLDNALKYSGGEPRITITLKEEAQRVVLKVADKGIGIPGEYSKKIFEKFFRVPTGDVHNVKGYGLGLSYVKAVILSHSGLIEVDSKPGEGSVFTIFLPKHATAS